MEKIPSRLKKSPLSIKGLVKWAVPLLLAAAVLVPTGVAVGLETSLTQARAELNRIQSGVPAADGGVQHDQEPGAAVPAKDTEDVPAPEDPGPEVPAYQELYPELYAQPHEWNSVNKAKVCYLTFDDGPSARTPEVLKILDRYGVKATFFVVGKDTEQSRQWMKQIVD